MTESGVRSLQQKKKLPEQGVDIINNSDDVCCVTCLLNSNKGKWNNIIDMAKQVHEPQRNMPRVAFRPYVVGEGERLTIPADLAETSRIVIYKPNTDEYFPLNEEPFQEYEIY